MSENTSASSPASPAPSPAPKKRRKWPIIVGVVILSIIVGLLLLPTILSMGIGRSIVESQASNYIAGRLTLDSLSLGWFSGQRITGVKLYDPDGKLVASANEISTQLTLLKAATGNLKLGETAVSGVKVDLVRDASGETNLDRAIAGKGPKKEKEKTKEPKKSTGEKTQIPNSLAVNLKLSDVNVTVTEPGKPPVAIQGMSAVIDMPAVDQIIKFDIKGRSAQGDLGGNFAANGAAAHVFDSTGAFTPEKLEANVIASADGLPVNAIDALAGQKGMITAALGDTINFGLKATGSASAQNVAVDVKSSNLTANLAAKTDGSVVTLTQPAVVRLVATPALVDHLVTGDDKSKLKLAGPVPVELTIASLAAPLASPVDLSKVAATLDLKTGAPVRLTGGEIGDVTVASTAAHVETKSLSQSVAFNLASELVTAGQPGKIAASGTVTDAITPAGKLQLDKLKADATAQLTNVPTALVDRLANQNGLLVDALGPTATIELAAKSTGADRVDVKLNAQSPLLKADVPTITLADTITTTGPIVINYSAPAALIKRYLPKTVDVQLEQQTPVQVTITQLSAPRPKAGEPAFQPAKTTVNADVKVGRLTVVVPQNSPAAQANAQPNAQAPAQPAPAAAPETITVDGLTASLRGKTLADLQLAVATHASMGGQPGIITKALGPTADLTAQAAGTFDNKNNFVAQALTADVKSPLLTVNIPAKLDAQKRLSLTAPAKLSETLTPELLAALGLKSEGLTKVEGPAHINATITRLDAPTENFSIDRVQLEMTGDITASGPGDAISTILGPKVDLAVQLAEADKGGTSPVALRIASDKVKADLTGAIKRTGNTADFALTKTATFDLVLTPQALAALNPPAPAQPGQQPKPQTTIAGPTPIHLEISQLVAQLQPFDLAKVKTALRAAIDQLTLAGDPTINGASLRNVKSDVTFDGSAGVATVKLDGAAAVNAQSQPGPLSIDAKLSKLFDNGKLAAANADIDAAIKFEGLPTAFVDALAAQNGKLVPLVGPSMNLTAAAKLSGGAKPTGTADVKIASENLAADAGVKIGQLIELTRPSNVKLTITPAAYAAMVASAPAFDPAHASAAADPNAPAPAPAKAPKQPLQLTAPAQVAIQLNALAVPYGDKLDIPNAKFDATVSIPQLAMLDPKLNQAFSVDQLSIAASSPALQQQLNVKLGGDVRQQAGGGKLQADAILGGLYDKAGKINTQTLSAKIEAALTGVPGSLVEAIAGQGDGKLQALIGKAGNLALKADLNQMNGPLMVKLDADNIRGIVPAMLQGDFATLTDDLLVEVRLTEELASKFIDIPMLHEAVSSQEPAVVRIGKRNMRYPWKNFDIRQVSIEDATINGGRIMAKKAGIIDILVELPSLVGGGLRGGDFSRVTAAYTKNTLPVWFAPAPFTLKDGVFTLGRMDALMGFDYQIATWGTIDFNTDHEHLVFGLAERAMRRVYGIPSFQDDPNYVDQFVIDGPRKTATINKTEMVGRITLLMSGGLASQIGGQEVGGAVGSGIKILGQVGSALDKKKHKQQGATPPPNRPWPWDKDPDYKDPGGVGAAAPQQGQQQPPTQQKKDTAGEVKDLINLFKKPKNK
jgi:hypothetical protein